jgi:hypothetical protein
MHVEIQHRCGRRHRGYQSLAECMWPDAAYVIGDGAFALLARCDLFTVSLYETRGEAQRRERALDARGCGRTCEGLHELRSLGGDADGGMASLDALAPQSAMDWLTS